MRKQSIPNLAALFACLVWTGCSTELAPHQREYLQARATDVAYELPGVASEARILRYVLGELERPTDESPAHHASRILAHLESLREWNSPAQIVDGSAEGYLLIWYWRVPWEGPTFSARLEFLEGEQGPEVILSGVTYGREVSTAARMRVTWNGSGIPMVSHDYGNEGGLTFRGPLQVDTETWKVVLNGEGSWTSFEGWGPLPVVLSELTFAPRFCFGMTGSMALGPVDVMVNSATRVPVITTVEWALDSVGWSEWLEMDGQRDRVRIMSSVC